MKATGIRELKARLSGFLREVQAGEIILVTDRGRVVAELRAPVGEPPVPDAYRRSPVRVRAGTARALLAVERKEG
jgi:antitoxin (DNA-binding transcriptional repressor) of toxin-antitoxin stability system